MPDTQDPNASQFELPPLIETNISSAARMLLSGVAGVLVAHGVITTDQTAQFIGIGSGIILWAVGAAWLAVKNRAQQRTVKQALMTPSPAQVATPVPMVTTVVQAPAPQPQAAPVPAPQIIVP